ncbi:PREDICTED: pleiotropic drug resistance protein 1-like [Ipomoea nil]|uniref:pleiotropic drug resistance protein 1-like n=1 Tax=Ipomoea nil TaxID=35883 RepID=UPI000900FB48|nr:PREDICTED: pleiotropic drug resistance protein 1-like [Ipomoea nil]
MEIIDDSYRKSGSFRISSGMDVFVKSSSSSRRVQEDEERALKWAALQRVPTYDRLKKALVTGLRGETSEIHINNIRYEDKKQILERLIKVPETDNHKFLLKLKDRIDRVALDIPTVEVRFEHLNVGVEAYVGKRALPSITNLFLNILEGLLSCFHLPTNKKHISILRDVSGIIKPGRMTLLLGPPSSGKTTLLLALAGQLDPSLEFSGRVSYNGHEMHEFVPMRTAAYISQHDLHIPEMTAKETLAFSARCQGVGSRYEMLAELSRREKAANIMPDPDIDIFMKAAATDGQQENVVVDYIIKILGLEGCEDTIVGNELLRGMSGGERKRLTIGEMLVGPANVFLMDEISTGLDSSTTFHILKSIRNCVHILHGTAAIALLQLAPECYDLFDDIILISEGQIVYQGPRDYVLEFFECMGFRCPERKGVADLLQEVTSKKDQKQYWVHSDKPYRFVTVKEFSEAFQSFHVGHNLGDELATPFPKATSHPAAITTKPYGVSKMELLKSCFLREVLLMKRNSALYLLGLASVILLAVITMTLFPKTNISRNSVMGAQIYMGSLFFSLSVFLFSAIQELAPTVMRLPVFYKQRDHSFYPASAYAIPIWILSIPISFVEVSIWVFSTYYAIGYDPNVERLFKQWVLLLIFKQTSSALFRCAAVVSRSMTVAFVACSFVILMMFSLGGFVLSRVDVKKWWLWGCWVSPLMYAQNAIAVNEFLGTSWNTVLPFSSSEPLGVLVLKYRGLYPEAYWYWVGVGALVGFTIIANFLYALALAKLRSLPQSHQVVISEESDSSNNGAGGGRAMILPFEPHWIAFSDVKYSVDMPQEMKKKKKKNAVEDRVELLKGVSGAFRPGILTALMGVSGAGKTTLMDVLAGRKNNGGYIAGNITVSGYTKKQKTFSRISGYCEQNDIHSPHLTVYESLLFSAKLRLPSQIDSETRRVFIKEVMELVELTSLGEVVVGLPGVNGLSTGQRKRLTIAVELVANPSIVFMDEPTTGLDARASAIIMRTIRNVVDTGRTIVCTIHQPSIHIFEAFDELLLMALGGQEIYFGPIGRRSCHLINYFESIQGISGMKEGYNPATWVLEITTTEKEVGLGLSFSEIYASSELCKRNKAFVETLSTPSPGSRDLSFPTQYSQSFSAQFLACLQNHQWSYCHNTSYTALRALFTIFIALLFGTMFWGLGARRNKVQDLFNAMGSMFASVFFVGTLNAFSVEQVAVVERTVFYRERAAGMYAATPFAFAMIVIEVPYILVQAVVYSVIVYSMIGFEWTANKFLWYLFIMFLTFLYSTFLGMMSVAMTPNLDIATLLATATFGIWNVFSGFLIPRPHAPVWWRWYFLVSPVGWTLYGLMVSQFGDVDDVLETFNTVEGFLRIFLGYKREFLGESAAILSAFVLLFALIFALCINLFNFQNR